VSAVSLADVPVGSVSTPGEQCGVWQRHPDTTNQVCVMVYVYKNYKLTGYQSGLGSSDGRPPDLQAGGGGFDPHPEKMTFIPDIKAHSTFL